MNEKNKIEVSVVTPLSVGEGEEGVWKRGVDYVVQDGKVYHIGIDRMAAAGLNIDRIAALLAAQDENGIKKLLGNRLEDVSDKVMGCPVSNPADIRMMIHEGLSGRPYIPGSSIKGAIRSALYGTWKEKDSDKEPDVFGQLKDGGDFMRFIQVSDVPFDSTRLVNTKIFNLQGGGHDWEGGWKHRGGKNSLTTAEFRPEGFNTLYECLAVGAKGIGSIKMAKRQFSQYNQYNQYNLPQPMKEKKDDLFDQPEYEPIENLFYLINNHTFDFLEREKKFFHQFGQADGADKIENNINMLLNKANACIDDGRSCLLKMAAGSGFHAVTGDWKYSDHTRTGVDTKTGKMRYKSRKIACTKNFQLMGFVKLTIID